MNISDIRELYKQLKSFASDPEREVGKKNKHVNNICPREKEKYIERIFGVLVDYVGNSQFKTLSQHIHYFAVSLLIEFLLRINCMTTIELEYTKIGVRILSQLCRQGIIWRKASTTKLILELTCILTEKLAVHVSENLNHEFNLTSLFLDLLSNVEHFKFAFANILQPNRIEICCFIEDIIESKSIASSYTVVILTLLNETVRIFQFISNTYSGFDVHALKRGFRDPFEMLIGRFLHLTTAIDVSILLQLLSEDDSDLMNFLLNLVEAQLRWELLSHDDRIFLFAQNNDMLRRISDLFYGKLRALRMLYLFCQECMCFDCRVS